VGAIACSRPGSTPAGAVPVATGSRRVPNRFCPDGRHEGRRPDRPSGRTRAPRTTRRHEPCARVCSHSAILTCADGECPSCKIRNFRCIGVISPYRTMEPDVASANTTASTTSASPDDGPIVGLAHRWRSRRPCSLCWSRAAATERACRRQTAAVRPPAPAERSSGGTRRSHRPPSAS
jgi:hypothetical protein